VLPRHPVPAAIIMLAFTALLYAIELFDQISGSTLDYDGVHSRSVPGLFGILWAPLLHGGWPHLWANTIPFLVFGFLAMAGGGGFLLAAALIRPSGMGLGDVKIAASIGLVLGWTSWQALLTGTFAGFALAWQTRGVGRAATAIALPELLPPLTCSCCRFLTPKIAAENRTAQHANAAPGLNAIQNNECRHAMTAP